MAKGLEKVSKQHLDITENIKIKILSKVVILKVQTQAKSGDNSGGMISALFYAYTLYPWPEVIAARTIRMAVAMKIEAVHITS